MSNAVWMPGADVRVGDRLLEYRMKPGDPGRPVSTSPDGKGTVFKLKPTRFSTGTYFGGDGSFEPGSIEWLVDRDPPTGSLLMGIPRTSGVCRRDEVKMGECFKHVGNGQSGRGSYAGVPIILTSSTVSVPSGWKWNSSQEGPGHGLYDLYYDGSDMVTLIPHWNAPVPAKNFTWYEKAGLTLATKCTICKQDLGQHHSGDNATEMFCPDSSTPSGFHPANHLTYKASEAPAALYTKVVGVVDDSKHWPHKCYGCGGSAYIGSYCQCKKKCRPEYA